MENDAPAKFSDEIRVAILNDTSRRSMENRARTEKARRNHIVSVFVAMFFGATGLYPSRVDVFGIEFDKFSSFSFYLFLSFLVVYMYWAYQTYLRSERIVVKAAHQVYKELINYSFSKVYKEIISPSEERIYRFWQKYMPIVVSIVAIATCLGRAVYEALHSIP